MADPGPTLDDGEVNPEALGLMLNDVDLGLVIATAHSAIDSQFLPSMYAARLNVGQAGLIGIPEFELSAEGIEVRYNGSGTGAGGLTATIDWESSFPGGYWVETGAAGQQVKIDYDADPFIGAYAEKATLKVADFLFITGSFAFEKGNSVEVDIAYGAAYGLYGSVIAGTVEDVECEVMTIGISNAYAFAGYITDGGDYLTVSDPGSDLDKEEINPNAIGLQINDLDGGIAMLKPSVPFIGDSLPNMTAGTLSAGQLGLIGIDGVTLEADNARVAFNNGDFAWVDYEGSFPAADDTPAGMMIETGGDPVYLDVPGNKFLGIYVEEAVADIFGVLALRGSFAFEQGGTEVVDIITGLPEDLSSVLPADAIAALTGLGLSSDGKRIEDLPVNVLSIGARDVHGFMGYAEGGYFLEDDSAQGWHANPDAFGLAIDNLDLGMTMMSDQQSGLIKTFAAEGDLELAHLVGVDEVTAEARQVELDLNWGAYSGITLPPQFGPVVDFASSFPAGDGNPTGYAVNTGGDNPIYLDMDERIVRAAVENLNLEALGIIQVVGSAAFVMRGSETVTLSDKSQIDVSSIALGISQASAFVGAGGPYLTDTNGDGYVNAADTPNSDAFGLVVDDLTGGFVFMQSLNLLAPDTFLAGTLDLDRAGLTGVDQITMQAEDMRLDVNVGVGVRTGLTTVDFSAFAQGEYLIDTGDPSNPVSLDYEGFILGAEGEAIIAYQVGGQDVFSLNGAFDFEITTEHLQVYADVTLAIGDRHSPLIELEAMGLLLLEAGGFAVKLDVELQMDLFSGFEFDADWLFQANTLCRDVVYHLPEGFPKVEGKDVVTIEGTPPDVGVTSAQPYALMRAEGTLTVFNALEMEGYFSLLLAPEVIDIQIQAGFDLFGVSASVDGHARLYTTGGLVLDAGVSLETDIFGVSGLFDMQAAARLQLNTMDHADMGIAAETVRVELSTLEVRLLSGLLTLEGSGYVDMSSTILQMQAELSADFFGIGQISAAAYFNSVGDFSIDLSGEVKIGWDSFGVWGSANFSMSYMSGVFDISGSISAGARFFGIGFNFPGLNFSYDGASGDFRLGVHIYVDFFFWELDETLWFTVANFGGVGGSGGEELPPVYLAGSQDDPTSFSGGALYLNSGQRAAERGHNESQIHEIYRIYHISNDSTGNPLTSEKGNETILVEFDGERQIYSGVSEIVMIGGTGADFIEVTPGVLSDLTFYGGYEPGAVDEEGELLDEGNYESGVIYKGEGRAVLHGGRMDDDFKGNDGDDEFYLGGTLGYWGDVAEGKDGNDVIVFGPGFFTLDGGSGDDAFYYSDSGMAGGVPGEGTIKDSTGDNRLYLGNSPFATTALIDRNYVTVTGFINDVDAEEMPRLKLLRFEGSDEADNTVTVEGLNRDFQYWGGSGKDQITVADSEGDLFIRASDGENSATVTGQIGDVIYYGGIGVDTVNMSEVSGDVWVETSRLVYEDNEGPDYDPADDRNEVTLTEIGLGVNVLGGAGQDTVKLEDIARSDAALLRNCDVDVSSGGVQPHLGANCSGRG